MTASGQPPSARPWHRGLPILPGARTARLRHRREGDALRDQRKWAEAATAYERHLNANHDDHAIWIQYAHVLKEAGQLQSALLAYERSVLLKPADLDRDLHMIDLRERVAATKTQAAASVQGRAIVSQEAETPMNGDAWSRPQPSVSRPIEHGIDVRVAGHIADRLRGI